LRNNPWEEVYQFLATSPSAEAILAFRPSEPMQVRLDELLDKGNEADLSAEEKRELDVFLEVDHFFTMLKIATRKRLAEEA
jgi:hypothetical protein